MRGNVVPTKEDLENWIAKKGLSKPEAAERLTVTPRTVYRWLKGTRKVPKWLVKYLK